MEDKKSFRENLIERIGNRSKDPDYRYFKLLEIVLLDGDPKELFSKSGTFNPIAHFPIQEDTCSIIENGKGVGLCFDRRVFLLSCIGKSRLNTLNANYKKVQKTLDNIENVLGKVPIVETLRENLKDYQEAISKFFDYNGS